MIEVTAAGVNRADLLQRQGLYSPPPGASELPGLECSGVVVEVGEGVSKFTAGEEVCALLTGGGYAEKVAVPWEQVLHAPSGIPLVNAAALPEAACTVWSKVFMIGRLRRGETLLVHGGTSGIGTMAIQMAKALGSYVVATAGTPEKVARCLELGADEAINYREEDFATKVKADVILDIIGAKYLRQNIEVLKTGGRLVVIGLQGGTRGEIDLGALLAKRGSLHATALRGRPVAEKGAIVRGVGENIWPLVSAGAVCPVIHEIVPMAEAARAHRILESGEHIGKVLLAR